MAHHDTFFQVEGLQARYIEDGVGPAVICLHGASGLLKEMYARPDRHIVDHRKHWVQRDAMGPFHRSAARFLPS